MLITLKQQWNTVGAGHTLAVTGRMVTHPNTNWAHSCLTLVISPHMFAPSQQGDTVHFKGGNTARSLLMAH